MIKLLVICGPTSTGKTRLAIHLAKKLGASGPKGSGPVGEIVSADSRQVYKGMDIGTGKDLPVGAKLKIPWFWKLGYYEVGGVKIWGYDLVDPRKEFSVAQYLRFVNKIIPDIIKRKKLPIIVGGTGLYVKAAVDGIPTAHIPRNESLRKQLEKKKQEELYEMLAQFDSIRAGGMNSSDRKNPRRLIRAIEVAVSSKKPTVSNRQLVVSSLFIGLTAPSSILFDRIETRVKERVKKNIEDEIKRLLKKNISWDNQSMASLGYRQWRDFFDGKKTKEEVIKDWLREEKKYAKRQMVWFKKDRRVNWFDINRRDFQKKVEKTAEKWYKQATG